LTLFLFGIIILLMIADSVRRGMSRVSLLRAAVLALLLLVTVATRAAALPPCAFTPAESRLTQFNIQGSFQLVESHSSEDRAGALTGNLQANFTQLLDSALFGYRLDGKARLDQGSTGLDFQASGAGNLKRYLQGNVFGVGALDFTSASKSPLAVDLTGGLGLGRFRDVTPLAKAIHIQNTLLDLGALEGPLTDETLQALAQELDRNDLSPSDKVGGLEKLLEATGLVAGGSLGARALLQIEEIVTSQAEARLCGWEIQTTIGLKASDLSRPQLSEALVVNWNYALVPDPVSQWVASARLGSDSKLLAHYSLQASVNYGRQIRDNWRVRADYTFTRDRSEPSAALDRHRLSGTMILQLSPGLSLTVSGELIYETGYEQPASNLAVQFSYDVF
jgi:hypothetical protein